jgi:hypothetical protein
VSAAFSATSSDENPSKRLVYAALPLGTAFALLSVRIKLRKEKHMNALSNKLTAFGAALVMNSLIMGAVGFLFEIQSHPHMSVMSFAKAVVAHQWLI